MAFAILLRFPLRYTYCIDSIFHQPSCYPFKVTNNAYGYCVHLLHHLQLWVGLAVSYFISRAVLNLDFIKGHVRTYFSAK